MASQVDKTRVYTSLDEADSPEKIQCPLCKVYAVPRGISSTRKNDIDGQEKHCPNCGHVHGRKNH
jgi:uncharacterized Zn finger protein